MGSSSVQDETPGRNSRLRRSGPVPLALLGHGPLVERGKMYINQIQILNGSFVGNLTGIQWLYQFRGEKFCTGWS